MQYVHIQHFRVQLTVQHIQVHEHLQQVMYCVGTCISNRYRFEFTRTCMLYVEKDENCTCILKIYIILVHVYQNLSE